MAKIYGERFAIVPEAVLFHPDLTDRAKVLWGALARYADPDGACFPGRRLLAERLRCSLASLDRALQELVTAEAVDVAPGYREDGGQSSNNYHLRTPPSSPVTWGGSSSVRRAPSSPTRPLEGDSIRNENQLEGLPPPTASAPTSGQRANTLLRAYCDELDARGEPRPAGNFGRWVREVRSILEAGWCDEEVAAAMRVAPTLSVGSLEFALRRPARMGAQSASPIDASMAALRRAHSGAR